MIVEVIAGLTLYKGRTYKQGEQLNMPDGLSVDENTYKIIKPEVVEEPIPYNPNYKPAETEKKRGRK